MYEMELCIRAKTSQEKLWFETLPEDSQWHWWGDTRRQTVPYTRSRNRKWAIAGGGVAHLWLVKTDKCLLVVIALRSDLPLKYEEVTYLR